MGTHLYATGASTAAPAGTASAAADAAVSPKQRFSRALSDVLHKSAGASSDSDTAVHPGSSGSPTPSDDSEPPSPQVK